MRTIPIPLRRPLIHCEEYCKEEMDTIVQLRIDAGNDVSRIAIYRGRLTKKE